MYLRLLKNKLLILLLLQLHVIWKIILIVPNSPKIYISFQESIWTSWTPFSPCTANCGGGNQSRSRNCWNAGSDHYVFDCPGNSSERRSCNTHRCTISNFYQKFKACLLCNNPDNNPCNCRMYIFVLAWKFIF